MKWSTEFRSGELGGLIFGLLQLHVYCKAETRLFHEPGGLQQNLVEIQTYSFREMYATDGLMKSVPLALNKDHKHDRFGCLTKQPLKKIIIICQ